MLQKHPQLQAPLQAIPQPEQCDIFGVILFPFPACLALGPTTPVLLLLQLPELPRFESKPDWS